MDRIYGFQYSSSTVQEGCLSNFVSISKLYKLLNIIFNVYLSEIDDLFFRLEGKHTKLY